MYRAVLLSMPLLLAAAPAAGAEIRVIDATTGASRTLLKQNSPMGSRACCAGPTTGPRWWPTLAGRC